MPILRVALGTLIGSLVLVGCSSAGPKTGNPADVPVAAPQAVVETGDGPSEADLPKVLDLPLYPGAKIVKNKAAVAGDEKRYHLAFETSDPLDKVATFYRAQGLSLSVQGAQLSANGLTKNGNMVLIEGTRKADASQVQIQVILGGK